MSRTVCPPSDRTGQIDDFHHTNGRPNKRTCPADNLFGYWDSRALRSIESFYPVPSPIRPEGKESARATACARLKGSHDMNECSSPRSPIGQRPLPRIEVQHVMDAASRAARSWVPHTRTTLR